MDQRQLEEVENKTHDPDQKAVALEYSPEHNAPKVVAKGQGYVAENILEKAREHGISTYYDNELLENLMAIAVGDEIPTELYEIVAKVLLFVEKVDDLPIYSK